MKSFDFDNYKDKGGRVYISPKTPTAIVVESSIVKVGYIYAPVSNS